MFAGAQIVTTKLIQYDQNQPVTVAQIDGKTNDTFDSLLASDRHVKSAILTETHEEKLERKQLVRERRYERIVEQQKIVHHMEELVEKVIRETPIPTTEENNLRQRIKTIIGKVKRNPEKLDELSASFGPKQSASAETTLKWTTQANPSKVGSQSAFLLWYDRSLH